MAAILEESRGTTARAFSGSRLMKAVIASRSISSDIVASLFMKPVGAAVHFRHGTINGKLVAWLCAGSVPFAFAGAWLISQVPDDVNLEVADKPGVLGQLTTILGAHDVSIEQVVQEAPGDGDRHADTHSFANGHSVPAVRRLCAPLELVRGPIHRNHPRGRTGDERPHRSHRIHGNHR